jgi:PKD repeat protein
VESVKKISKITMNFRPTIDSLTLPTAPVVTGASVTAKAVFTDSYDTHTAVFDWGDGLTSSGVVDEKAQNVSGTHTYAKPGFYKVTLTLVDSMKVEATATSGKPVIVYDPKSGFVAGVGSISSPASAYTADPSLTGIATVELLARYPVVMKKDFTGVTAFQFVKAKKAFTSTSYDWLVIQREAKKAFYQGSGKINGKGDYAFLVSVIDGGSKPAQDRFRIKIWDKVTGAIVYDTQPGDADTADPTTPLTKGILAIERFQ